VLTLNESDIDAIFTAYENENSFGTKLVYILLDVVNHWNSRAANSPQLFKEPVP
jgi:hypothetical protein